MQTTFFIALISLAVFVQAAPTPQLGLPVGGLAGSLGGLGGLTGGVAGLGGLTGGLGGNTAETPGAGADGPAPATGESAEARSVKGPTIWKRQGGVDPNQIIGGVTGAGSNPGAAIGGAVTSLTGAGGNTPAQPGAAGGEDEA